MSGTLLWSDLGRGNTGLVYKWVKEVVGDMGFPLMGLHEKGILIPKLFTIQKKII